MERVWVSWSRVLGLLIASAGACLSAELKALDPAEVAREFHQRSWRHEHGLPPGDRVHAILQTRDGYLWVGTQYGLARFDGLSFVVFDHVNTPVLSNDDCRTLAEDAEGNLWIGTKDGLFCRSGNQFTRFNDRKPGFTRLTAYPPLCASQGGGVWVGGMGCVIRIRGETVRFHIPAQTLPIHQGEVTTLEEDADGSLWIGTPTGLVRFDERRERFEVIELEGSFKHSPVFDIWRAPDGKLWVLSADGPLVTGEPGPNTRILCLTAGNRLQPPAIVEQWAGTGWQGHLIVGDRHGTVWLAGGPGGIRRYRNGGLERLPVFFREDPDPALSVFPDREGNLWVGADKSGLHLWTPRKVTPYTVREGLAHDNVWSIIQGRDGSVWVGTDGGVTQFKDGESASLKRPDGSQPQDVRAVAEDLDGTIWVGTMRSLECFSRGVSRHVDLPGEWFEAKIRALCPARDGSMWIGTVRGLTRVHQGQRTKYTRADGLGSDEIRAIVEDRAGDLWVGTFGGGLSRFRNGRFTTLTTTNGLSSNEVWALHEHQGVLWIGTDNGLSRFEAGQITSFTTAQGLPDSLVNSVLSDDSGRLWVGHDRGIYAVEMRQLLEVARGRRTTVDALNFDESDGLLSAETNGQKSYPAACKARDGRLWFPTTRGVAIIDPAKLSLSETAPLVVIEAVRANGKAVFGTHPQAASEKEPRQSTTPRGVDLRLPPGGARVLEFQYTANTFTAPEKARFRYRLIGLDRNWIEAGTRRQAYFANLAPGDYRFEVLAGNHHGVWQEKSSSVAFQLMPFYYQTWWFYAVCGAGIAALGALAIRWRVRELRRIYDLRRTNALNEQRRRIARDIHDELGSSLTHILQLSDPARTSAGKPNGRDQKAERIATIAEEAVDNIGEIVWANNPEYDTLEDLVAYLREYAANCFADTNVHVRCQFPDVVPCRTVSGLFRRHLVLLMKEALHNVAKHADARQVDVRLSLREGWLELAVMDDGRGLPAEGAMRQGNGLNNMRARVDELKGEFLINSEASKGTKIHVVVPLSNP